MPVNGVGLASVAFGSVFLYAGIKGYSVPQAFQAILTGKSPTNLTNTSPITNTTIDTGGTSGGSPYGGGTFSGTVVSGGSAKQILQQTAARFGWTGSQWQCLDNVEMAEAGYDTRAKNPSSGALGMAQALGHGGSNTAGSLGNEYGGFGLSAAQAKAANSGDAGAQALWMCNYIKATYGNPCNAWAHEQSHHWY